MKAAPNGHRLYVAVAVVVVVVLVALVALSDSQSAEEDHEERGAQRSLLLFLVIIAKSAYYCDGRDGEEDELKLEMRFSHRRRPRRGRRRRLVK